MKVFPHVVIQRHKLKPQIQMFAVCLNGLSPTPTEKERLSTFTACENTGGHGTNRPARESAAFIASAQERPVSSEPLLLTHEFSKTLANSPFMSHHALLMCGKTNPGCPTYALLAERTPFRSFLLVAVCISFYPERPLCRTLTHLPPKKDSWRHWVMTKAPKQERGMGWVVIEDPKHLVSWASSTIQAG